MVVRYATMSRSLAPSDAIKQAIRRQVVAVFNDGTRGETPVPRSADALFDRTSVAWRVHGDVTSMTIAVLASLLKYAEALNLRCKGSNPTQGMLR